MWLSKMALEVCFPEVRNLPLHTPPMRGYTITTEWTHCLNGSWLNSLRIRFLKTKLRSSNAKLDWKKNGIIFIFKSETQNLLYKKVNVFARNMSPSRKNKCVYINLYRLYEIYGKMCVCMLRLVDVKFYTKIFCLSVYSEVFPWHFFIIFIPRVCHIWIHRPCTYTFT